MNIIFTIPRPDESLVAIISADVSNTLSPDDIMQHLSDAVTLWINQTLEGKKYWFKTFQYMNIGDLALHGIPKEVNDYLILHDIYNFTLETKGSENVSKNWVFDSILYNENEMHKIIPSPRLREKLKYFDKKTELDTLLNMLSPEWYKMLKSEIEWLTAYGFKLKTIKDILSSKIG